MFQKYFKITSEKSSYGEHFWYYSYYKTWKYGDWIYVNVLRDEKDLILGLYKKVYGDKILTEKDFLELVKSIQKDLTKTPEVV